MSKKQGKSVSQMIRESWGKDDPTGWFDVLYDAAKHGDATVPWAYMQPHPKLVEWLDREQINGDGKRALVVGCGLGDDAVELAKRGFQVTAFDVSQKAIDWAKERFPGDEITFLTADLFTPPDEWHGAFDFVLESRTIQAIPYQYAEQAIANIASFVKVGGRLLVMCFGREPEQERRGIPWALSREELSLFQSHGLIEKRFEETVAEGGRRFRIEYIRQE